MKGVTLQCTNGFMESVVKLVDLLVQETGVQQAMDPVECSVLNEVEER